MKKIIVVFLLIIALLVIAGGGFLWRQASQAVAGLNKTLPQGVKVVKSLIGNDFWVKNKIDGYEFKAPRAWGGIEEVEYIAKRKEEGFEGSSFFVEGITGEARTISIDVFAVPSDYSTIREWSEKFFVVFGLIGSFEEISFKDFKILKTIEDQHLGGAYLFLSKIGDKIYVFTGGSEESIREIILNGKW